jgi:hypothetical protein
MRLLLLMLGIGVCVVGLGTRAEAQNYPWCAYYGDRIPDKGNADVGRAPASKYSTTVAG